MVLTLAVHYDHPRSFKNNPIQGPTSDQPNQDLGGWNPGMCVSQMSLVSLMGCQVSSPRDKDAASVSKSWRPAHMRESGRRAPLQVLLRGRRRLLGVTIPSSVGLGAISLFDSLSTLPRISVPSEEGSRVLAVTGAC